MSEHKLPHFESEAEEAQWWFDHREEIGQDIVKAARRGTLGEGSLARRARKLGAPQTRSLYPDQQTLRVLSQVHLGSIGVGLVFDSASRASAWVTYYTPSRPEGSTVDIFRAPIRGSLACR